ncbi:lipopolysaccharide/colanic/teichoic acid biosynthesis glycosyltransferase [Anaerotaenia torta]|uniref:sugar transferase n=1 Tax=Anaerotaenia torta TaxID=433293 RepID=UPI003D1F2ACB
MSLVRVKARKGGIYRKYIKRLTDIILSLIAIVVLSPVLVIVGILVRVKLGSPVLFKQKRPGLNEKIFIMYKFRTMTDEKDENGELLPDSIRLTKFGKTLRATSLDELPELFNILKGNMSIVGPRPQLVRDMVFMTPDQRKRHDILPGLTGWAQINGRNNVEWEGKLALDLEYTREISCALDWKIMFLTAKKVISKEDINTGDMATTEDFGDYLLHRGFISKTTYDLKQQQALELLAEGDK